MIICDICGNKDNSMHLHNFLLENAETERQLFIHTQHICDECIEKFRDKKLILKIVENKNEESRVDKS